VPLTQTRQRRAGEGVVVLAMLFGITACGEAPRDPPETAEGPAASTAQTLSDDQLEDLVRQSYRFVAMYNVNNKAALDPANPLSTGGWNRIKAATRLADHTMKAIARPNNDTLYVTATLDLTGEPVILESPAFDSKYVSLMVTGYDHYVNIPMSTRQGHFAEPSRILFYTERTPGYSGDPVEGVDMITKVTGDFVSAVYRVMPHANEPDRFRKNVETMQAIRVITLSDYLGAEHPDVQAVKNFPSFGKSDFDVFENNYLEVMQFVFNHTSFDPDDPIDNDVLAALEPLGVEPGRMFDPDSVVRIDGARIRGIAERVASEELSRVLDPEFAKKAQLGLFLPKGQTSGELLLFQSILGPIGQPAIEAVYPSIATADGAPMTATQDYVIRIKAEDMPPATAFWSVTLYDTANGFFMPNERKKYSVGENGGMRLDADGGIAIYISAEQPAGVPDENWLPVVRGDYAMDAIMRIYAPDLGRLQKWQVPVAEILK